MNVYERWILPRLIDLSMKHGEATRHRQSLLPAARGRVLEIGIGSGLNLPFYGQDVESVVGVDPSEELLGMARGRLKDLPFQVELQARSAEALPFDDGRFDTAVTTWTLCSVPDARLALAELRRVLKPGGELIFVEHGRAEAPAVVAWQERLNRLWGCLAGGCNLNRPVAAMIREAGFRIEELETGHLIKGPRLLTYLYRGRARPA
ncbi:MAG: class I SAM-dependent methyltransferase [Kiloniellales bacterium]|nr:class I SAM-dependent methyltransferase [Kiloniellales bacterium]